MTNKRSTKRALLLSALSLLLCVSMLVGSTFAWFTDSVTSGNNIIKSGKLEVALLDADGKSLEGKPLEFVDQTGKVLTNILWEPGCTYTLQPVFVKNIGTLALKYEIVISGIEGNAKLLEAIDWTITGASLKGSLEPEETTKALQITGHMKEEAGNEYQDLEMDGISITVYATQYTSESDSFGPDYDKTAPLLVWDGTVDTSWYDASATTYELSSPAKLAGLAKLVNEGNSFADKTIKLATDMDLNNLKWTAIGTGSANFNGKFYGNGYTVYNLNVSGTKGVGLIGFAGNAAHIEGVHIVGANVTGENSVGAVLGYGYLAKDCLKNCVVEDALVFALAGAKNEDGDKVGAVAGWTSNGNIIGNKAIDCEVYGCRDMGGIVGYVNGENRAVEISGNAVENVTLSVIKAEGYDSNKLGTNINDTVGRTGTKVTVKDNSGKIIKEENTVVASSNDSLKKAAAAGGEVVVVAGNYTFPAASLSANTTLNCAPGTVFEGTSKLNIKGATVVGATFSNPTGTAADQTINGKFVDCVFEGQNGLRWCYSGDTVEFENCVFSGSTYGVHFDGGAKEVTFKDCTISGFNATAGTIENITFDGCTFVGNGKSAYNGINLWGNGDFKDCTFVFDGSTKNEWIDLCSAEKTATFTNCVVTDGKTEKGVETVVSKRHATAEIVIDGVQFVTTNDNLKAVIAAGETKVLLADGEYDLNGIQKDGLTLIGVGDDVKVANTTKYASGKAIGAIWQAIKLKNVTITNTVYTMADGGKSTFTNVNFAAGFRQGYGTGVEFTNCTFGSNSEGYALHFQTDSASEGGLIKLNGCKFEGGNVHLGGKRAYEFTNCDFAAGTDFQVWSNITLENCTVNSEKVTAENMATLFPKLDATKVTIK